MARRRIDLSVRFADVMPLWQIADINGSFATEVAQANKAVNIMQRLHKARVALRDQDDEGFCVYDRFVVRVDGCKITITPRETLDTSKFYTLDGKKIDYAATMMQVEESRRLREALENDRPLEMNKGQILQKLYSPKPPPPDDHPGNALDNLTEE